MTLRARLFLLTAIVSGALAVPAEAANPRLEHQVKAEFIQRFTGFIDWPPSAFASAGAPFVLCLFGEGAVVGALEKVAARGPILQRPVRVRHESGKVEPAAIDGCTLAYLAPSVRALVPALVARAAGRPVLLVGDTPGYVQLGVAINLYLEEQTFVRFEINTDAVTRSGLKLSAKLLRLARLHVPGR